MSILKVKHYKQLLQHLNEQHSVILNISLWTHSSKRMRLSVAFDQMEKYFTKYMYDAYNYERLTFHTIEGDNHDYEKRQIRILKLDSVTVSGETESYHISSFKELIHQIKGDREIILCFTVKPFRRKRMYLKASYKQVERFFNHELFFRCPGEYFKFTAPNGKKFKFSKYRLDGVELESVVFESQKTVTNKI